MLKQKLVLDTAPGKPRKVGVLTIVIVFGFFGGWGTFAPLEGAAIAPGVVEVKNHRRTVQHFEGGIVKVMHVREGTHVDAGQLLIELDETQDEARLEITLGQYLAAKAEESRLLAEQLDLETIRFESEFVDQNDPRFNKAMISQISVFDARKRSLDGQKQVLRQTISQQSSRITGIESIIRGKQELIESYSLEIADYKSLLEDGYADKIRLRELERQVSQLQAEVADREASIAEAYIEIGEGELQILQMDKEFQAEVAGNLDAIRKQLFDLEQSKRAIAHTLARTDILAPVSGIVINMSVTTVGGVVGPGEPLLDIVPETEELVLQAKLAPKDVDRVFVGQEADIRFSAFSGRSSPVIQGELIGISADILIDERTGAPHYGATVEITDPDEYLRHQADLVPGMQAQVLIKTGNRTLFQYLIAPVAESLAVSMKED